MENLIHHFKFWNEGLILKKNFSYQAVESPKGEFGVSLVSNSTNKPFKCKIRSPAYHSLQFLSSLSKGHYLADLVALIGTIDIVFGEIDR
jgi:NADH-quinone oxidoreductase subunit D